MRNQHFFTRASVQIASWNIETRSWFSKCSKAADAALHVMSSIVQNKIAPSERGLTGTTELNGRDSAR
jgi:hypothetical protein